MKIATWEQKQIQMAACKTYEELGSIVRRTNIDHHFYIQDSICHTKTSFDIAHTALVPCKCDSDGNCFMRAVSFLVLKIIT